MLTENNNHHYKEHERKGNWFMKARKMWWHPIDIRNGVEASMSDVKKVHVVMSRTPTEAMDEYGGEGTHYSWERFIFSKFGKRLDVFKFHQTAGDNVKCVDDKSGTKLLKLYMVIKNDNEESYVGETEKVKYFKRAQGYHKHAEIRKWLHNGQCHTVILGSIPVNNEGERAEYKQLMREIEKETIKFFFMRLNKLLMNKYKVSTVRRWLQECYVEDPTIETRFPGLRSYSSGRSLPTLATTAIQLQGTMPIAQPTATLPPPPAATAADPTTSQQQRKGPITRSTTKFMISPHPADVIPASQPPPSNRFQPAPKPAPQSLSISAQPSSSAASSSASVVAMKRKNVPLIHTPAKRPSNGSAANDEPMFNDEPMLMNTSLAVERLLAEMTVPAIRRFFTNRN